MSDDENRRKRRGRRLWFFLLGGAATTTGMVFLYLTSATHRPGLPGVLAAADGGAASAGSRRPTSDEAAGATPAARGEEEVRFSDFVGAEKCAECHRAEYDRWRASTHGRAGGLPGKVEVIARFDGQPLHFRDAVVTPRKEGDVYTFTVEEPGKKQVILRVSGVVGGGHMVGGGTQGFFSTFPDGTYRFIPFDFIRKEGVWFCNARTATEEGLIPITRELSLHECADWPQNRVLGASDEHENCQSCHGSQVVLDRDVKQARWRTRMRSLAIDCETCHGPGRRHLQLVADPAAVAAGDVGMQAFDTLTKDASLGVCWQCHALKSTLRPGFLSGKPLESYYSLLMPQLGEEPHHPDGRTKTFAYQQGHLWSDCYLNGSMTCTSCHDPHSQTYRDEQGRPLRGRFDDGQCTGCHPSKQERPQAHTHHAPTSEGSRCVACHMPFLQQPDFGRQLGYARSDHAIPIPRHDLDQSVGVRNACRGCHPEISEADLGAKLTAWYGVLKPLARGVAAAFEVPRLEDATQAARLVLRHDEKHAAALYTGLARFTARFLRPDMGELPGEVVDRLLRLGEHENLDVRALALASLDLAIGHASGVHSGPVQTGLLPRPTPQNALLQNRLVQDAQKAASADPARARAALEQHRRATGEPAERVRQRWAATLAFYAEEARERGVLLQAVALYEKALAVEPARPDVLTSLGVALADGGRLDDAARVLRRSLELLPEQPRALLRLGLILRELRARPAALLAFRQAVAIDDGAALAHLQLGEAALEDDQVDAALHHAARAEAGDSRLAAAHVLRAQALLRKRSLPEALRAVEAGLALDPDHRSGLELRAFLVEELEKP